MISPIYYAIMTRLDRSGIMPYLIGAFAVAAWVALGFAVAARYQHARDEFTNHPWTPPDERRADGGLGHTHIDFGGQYVLARMILTGQGRKLYHRDRLREAVRVAFPVAGQSPEQLAGRADSDEKNMMYWFMGMDDGPEPRLGGPLYPPTHACVYAPLALWPTPRAYHLFQIISLGAALLAALALALTIDSKLWLSWPLIGLVVLGFPHQQCGIDLGQNQTITLLILSSGVLARERGYSVGAGLIWSLLAFKPTWAVAFLAVPLFMRDWRMLAGMVVGGATWVLATLPVVGIQSWFDWLEVGKMAAAEYETNLNWTRLSRDLGGLFRRLLVDFDAKPIEPSLVAGRLGLIAVAGVLVVTGWVSWFRARGHRDLLGFACLGAYLACFRFVYYDAVVAALPTILLCRGAARFRFTPIVVGSWRGYLPSLTLILVGLLLLWENVIKTWPVSLTLTLGEITPAGIPGGDGSASAATILIDTTVYTPSDTVILLILWSWWALKLSMRK